MNISVIIPVRNEEASIRPLLDSLLNQTLKPSEVVITDGGSTDDTLLIISEYIRRGAPVSLVQKGAALPGRGRNLAAAHANTEWLAFIDAGIRPDTEWLAALAERAAAEGAAVVYGAWQPVINSFFKECAAIAYVPPPVASGDSFIRPRAIASALMKKNVWEVAGGFPEDLRSGEDLLFMNKIEASGATIAVAPKALVHWSIQPTIWTTFMRFVTYSRSNIRAGLWAEWQSTLFRRYALLLLLVLPVFFLRREWMAIGVALPVVAWLLLLLLRSIVAIHRNRQCYPAGPSRNLARLVLVAIILGVIDIAAIVGTLQWLVLDRSYSTAARSGS